MTARMLSGLATWTHRADAARRLGWRPVSLYALHRLRLAAGLPQRALALAAAPVPPGPVLPDPVLSDHRLADPALPAFRPCSRPSAAPPAQSGADEPDPAPLLAHLRAAEAGTPAPDSPPEVLRDPALGLDLFAGADARLGWEANRWAELPLLALAARADPPGPWRNRAEARLRRWLADNPPFHGPNWSCGQEAALRALHLSLALVLARAPDRTGGAPEVSGAAAAILRRHAARIAATRTYARAQDNNHPISEAAGLHAIALMLGEDPSPHAAALSSSVARLVGPRGGFAPVSTGYHRLLLDTLSVTEWLRRACGAPPLPPPFAGRAAAATLWLARLVAPGSGALPRLGHQDGSRFADLSLCGEADARGSVERASRLFLGRSAGFAADPGCAWLMLTVDAAPALAAVAPADAASGARSDAGSGASSDLGFGAGTDERLGADPNGGTRAGPAARAVTRAAGARTGPSSPARGGTRAGLPAEAPDAARAAAEARAGVPVRRPATPAPLRWHAEGSRGWECDGARALLRTGPLRFRPHQADLLNLDLWDGDCNLLRDGGSFLYGDRSGASWRLAGAGGHNAARFDGEEPMPRTGRFLLARWPRTGPLPDGAWSRDRRGHLQCRRVRARGRAWTVEDRLEGRFREASLRWRLAPSPDHSPWRLRGAVLESPLARIAVSADAPLTLTLEPGEESPAYGALAPVPVLTVRVPGPSARVTTRFRLPPLAAAGRP